jgi:hypothetical protein
MLTPGAGSLQLNTCMKYDRFVPGWFTADSIAARGTALVFTNENDIAITKKINPLIITQNHSK